MKYFSIDIETTGLSPLEHSVLEVGVVFEDTKNLVPIEDLPSLRVLIYEPDSVWSYFCVGLHQKIAAILRDVKDLDEESFIEQDGYYIAWPGMAGKLLKQFIYQHIKKGDALNVAGKNFNGFDKPFLEQLGHGLRFKHRVIDPAVLYADWDYDDCLPSLQECIDRAGLQLKDYHTAVGDARMVVELIRASYA